MKVFVCLLVAVLAAAPAFADPPDEDVLRPYVPDNGKWFLQFDLGLNYTFLDGNPVVRGMFQGEADNGVLESANGLAPLFSGTIGYRFSKQVALTFGVAYDARSASRSMTGIDTCPRFDEFGTQVGIIPTAINKDYSIDVDYLSLSLLPQFYIDDLYIYLGPTVSVPLSQKMTETDMMEDPNSECVYFYNLPDSTRLISGSSTGLNAKTRVSLKVGAGYLIPISSNIDLVPQVGFDFGLTDTFDPNGSLVLQNTDPAIAANQAIYPINDKIRINSLQASLGLRINL